MWMQPKIACFKYLLFFLALVLSGQYAVSQTVDSLKQILSEQRGTERISTLSDISYRLSATNPNEALDYSRRALQEALSIRDSVLISKMMVDIAYIYRRLGNVKAALNYLKRSQFIAFKLNDYESKIASLTGLGSLYTRLNLYDSALHYHVMAFNLKEDRKDVAKYATSYNNIGLVFYKIDDTEKALENYRKALYYKLQEGDTLRTISTYFNIGLVYNELEEDSLALSNFYKAVEYSRRFHQSIYLAAIYGGLGNTYTRINDFDSASHYLKLSMQEAERLKDISQQSFNFYTLAKLYAKNGDYGKARDYIKHSQRLASTIVDKQRQKNNFRLLAEIFENMNEYDSAFHYQKMYSVLEDEIFNEGLARNLANIQIALSEEQNLRVIEEQEEQLTKNKQVSLFLLSIIVLSVTLIIVIFRNFRNTSRINQQLNESAGQIEKQKENLERKNSELAKAQKTINDQNAILKSLNTELERKVDDRTRELKLSNKELEKAVHDLDQFIYKTSHDLRGPIATMMGIINLGVLESKDARTTEYFTTLNKVTANLNNVLSRLIEVHETYQMKPSFRMINPIEEIEASIRKVFEFLPDSAVRVETELKGDSQWVSDKTLFSIIIESMLRNAVLYTDRNEPYIKVQSAKENGLLKITFTDNGFGIQPGDEKKVFNIFFKGSPRPGGTGLEIYTAKVAVEKLGGRIRLIKPVKDTIFEIELPELAIH